MIIEIVIGNDKKENIDSLYWKLHTTSLTYALVSDNNHFETDYNNQEEKKQLWNTIYEHLKMQHENHN